MSELIRRLLRSNYWNAVAKLAGATGVAQLIGFVTSLFVARLYTPEMTGVLGVVLAIVGIVSPLAALRYEMAIPLVREEKDARYLLRICIAMAVFVAIASTFYILLLLLRPDFAPADDLGSYVWFLPVLILGNGILNCLRFWCNRAADFALLSRIRIGSAVGTGLTVVPFAWILGGDSTWLFVGQIVSLSIGIFLVVSHFGLWRPSLKFEKIGGLSLLREYRQFPFYNAPLTLLDQSAALSPALLLAAYYSTATTGQFNLAMLIVRVPSALIGAAVAQVFYSRAAGLRDQPQALSRLVITTTVLLVAIAVPMIFTIWFFGVDLFLLIFNRQWQQAGEFSTILVWPAALALILSPTSMLPSLLNLQHRQLMVVGSSSLLRVVVLWIACFSVNVHEALFWFAITESIGRLVYAGWIAHEMRSRRIPC
ncbi:oligosaccharide flippase family protein [Haloferula chungangensis]|uniref:Oligosaccharide flippase family protein n=1 Tax=Haloferula chungangensis TaxID=1048331 RepID=A0ABW2L8S1_9BACT